jgi:hypothetical protein
MKTHSHPLFTETTLLKQARNDAFWECTQELGFKSLSDVIAFQNAERSQSYRGKDGAIENNHLNGLHRKYAPKTDIFLRLQEAEKRYCKAIQNAQHAARNDEEAQVVMAQAEETLKASYKAIDPSLGPRRIEQALRQLKATYMVARVQSL